MARTNNLTNFLTDVATAIKTKKGNDTPIPASDFDTEIIDLPSGGGLDWSAIGYSEAPQIITNEYNYSKQIYDNWDSTLSLVERFYTDRKLVIMPLVDTKIGGFATNMFYGCWSLEEIPLLDFSNVTNCTSMFMNCSKLKIVANLDLSNVTNCSSMFYGCSVLETIPNFNTSKCENMTSMFNSCAKLKTVPLIDTSKCTTMRTMFIGCYELENLPIFDLSALSSSNSLQNFVADCTKLTDTSVDNILQMCITVTSAYKGSKTLSTLGLRAQYYPVSRIQALPHYQDFIDAGWTIGY